jgi:predicted dehydrogenase
MLQPPLKRVGFVDHDLDNYHANTFLSAIRGPLAHRGFVVAGATACLSARGQDWATANKVRYYSSTAELAGDVDFFMVLAPSKPDRHLALCEQVLPCGKTTFVDKTFAPDLATAEQIFALADRHRAAIQTTSVLRYSNVRQEAFSLRGVVRNIYVWAGGGSLAEYGIHPVELIVSSFGMTDADVMCTGTADHPQILIRFPDGRAGVIDFTVGVDVTYAAAITTGHETHFLTVDLEQLFVDAADAILNFFEAGEAQVDREETLLVRRILDAVELPAARQAFHRLDPALASESKVPPPNHRARLVMATKGGA